MNFTKEQILHIAKLSKLQFIDSELESFTEGFTKIIGYIDHLNEANTDGIEPLTNSLEEVNILPREDIIGKMLLQSEALQNAPKRIEGFFGVPKVIGDISE
ncbi:MAG: Asp-tRNA(Asn)/Glu-tRNA(Gln) amidotransferase subunit GatC [Chlorobiota bacterium]|jgi:aspartyl-tRNA(Asn)/glutamyl-tRNA(Gln) amidotransferase subunit C|nr:Asp-tRNA(Asn)/Glu-tRNA(Gln) amidotransferase subunit GatC [Chlorobiota bacterium]QQS66966.1 MAG: Asp-tRNA(Asn)/Glu-tRNA(Gln) amidotransferase subunit GatC [Chlorobiota bacterium]